MATESEVLGLKQKVGYYRWLWGQAREKGEALKVELEALAQQPEPEPPRPHEPMGSGYRQRAGYYKWLWEEAKKREQASGVAELKHKAGTYKGLWGRAKSAKEAALRKVKEAKSEASQLRRDLKYEKDMRWLYERSAGGWKRRAENLRGIKEAAMQWAEGEAEPCMWPWPPEYAAHGPWDEIRDDTYRLDDAVEAIASERAFCHLTEAGVRSFLQALAERDYCMTELALGPYLVQSPLSGWGHHKTAAEPTYDPNWRKVVGYQYGCCRFYLPGIKVLIAHRLGVSCELCTVYVGRHYNRWKDTLSEVIPPQRSYLYFGRQGYGWDFITMPGALCETCRTRARRFYGQWIREHDGDWDNPDVSHDWVLAKCISTMLNTKLPRTFKVA